MGEEAAHDWKANLWGNAFWNHDPNFLAFAKFRFKQEVMKYQACCCLGRLEKVGQKIASF